MSGVRILVTGSRDWWDWHVVAVALRQAYLELSQGRQVPLVVVHGGARGADACAARAASRLGLPIEVSVEEHPADWDRYGKAAGHRRNAEMVALGADICLAFPLGESRGTRGCMRLAEKAGIPVVNHGDQEAT